MSQFSQEDIKVQRLYLQIFDQLKNMIATEGLKPGDRLPSERNLAEQLGVSRPPLREAIIALEVKGIVEVKPGSGVYVRAPQEQHASIKQPEDLPGPFEILEARRLFEADACALAAERISNEKLQLLEQLLKSLEAKNTQLDAGEAEKIDQQFHLIIADATRNSAVSSTIRWLWELRNKSEISALFHKKLRQRGSLPTVDDHRQILAALMQRDSQAARVAMEQHLGRVIDELTRYSLESYE